MVKTHPLARSSIRIATIIQVYLLTIWASYSQFTCAATWWTCGRCLIFAVKRKYLAENPGLAVDLPRTDENPPGIISATQVAGLLDACLDTEPDILLVLVLSLFGGVRRSEAEKIAWTEIGAEFIEIKAEKAKTRRRRLIPISTQLRAWLECARETGGKLPAVTRTSSSGRWKRPDCGRNGRKMRSVTLLPVITTRNTGMKMKLPH